MKSLTKVLFALAVLVLAAAPASADTFTFSCTTNNSGNCSALTTQLTVDVTDAGGGNVQFVFSNLGPLSSSITDVYFGYFGSNPSLLNSFVSITGSAGVSFSSPASPSTFNFGGSPFVTSPGLTADSDSPVAPNGVNPGETLTIIISLSGSSTFADVINSMNAGNLSIGIHVQGFGPTGDSEGLVVCAEANGCTPVPEPASLALFGTGLLGLAGLIRRRFLS